MAESNPLLDALPPELRKPKSSPTDARPVSTAEVSGNPLLDSLPPELRRDRTTAPTGGDRTGVPTKRRGAVSEETADSRIYQAIKHEIENRGNLDRPKLLSDKIADIELRAIARNHGILNKQDMLRSLLTFEGGAPSEYKLSDVPGMIGSLIGEGPLLGVPQKVSSAIQKDPRVEAAIEDVRDLARVRASFAVSATEMVLPGAGLAKVVQKGGLVAGAAVGAAMGAIGSATRATPGEELSAAAVGAGAGAVVGTAVPVVARAAGKIIKRALDSAFAPKQADLLTPVITGKLDEQISRELPEKLSQGAAVRTLMKGGQAQPEELAKVIRYSVSKETEAELRSGSTVAAETFHKRVINKHGLDENLTTFPDDLQRAISRELEEQSLTSEYIRFVKHRKIQGAGDLTPADVANKTEKFHKVNKLLQAQGDQYIDETWEAYNYYRVGSGLIKSAGARVKDATPVDAALRIFSDSEPVVLSMAEVHNLPKLYHAMLDLTYAAHKSSFARTRFSSMLNEMSELMPKTADEGRVLMQQLRAGVPSAKQSELGKKTQEYWKQFRQFVTKEVGEDGRIAPLATVKKNAGDIPLVPLEYERLVPALHKEVAAALSSAGATDLSSLTAKQVRGLSGPAWDRVVSAVKWVHASLDRKGTAEEFLKKASGRDIQALLNDALSNPGSLYANDKMVRRYLGEVLPHNVPGFLQEDDMYRAFSRGTSAVLQYVYARGPISAMKASAKLLRSAGGTRDADYLDRLVGHVTGARQGLWGNFAAKSQAAYNTWVDSVTDAVPGKVAKDAVQALKVIPDVMSFVVRDVLHPAVLGMRADQGVINLAQPAFRLIPYMGAEYGTDNLGRAYARLMKDPKLMGEALERGGHIAQDHVQSFNDAATSAIRHRYRNSMPAKAVQAALSASMAWVRATERITRAIAVESGKILADDVARGVPAALAAFKKLPTSIRSGYDKLSPERQAQLLSEYINQKISLSYNKHSMSEYGRTLGPLFSAFTKWPTTVYGELHADIRQKGAIEGGKATAARLGGPLAAATLFDYAITGGEGDEGLTERQKFLLGNKGLTGATPATALASVIETFGVKTSPTSRGRGLLDAPALRGAQATASGLILGDMQKAGLEANRALSNFTPGSEYFRFGLIDVPQLITNRPIPYKGKTPVQRMERGANILKHEFNRRRSAGSDALRKLRALTPPPATPIQSLPPSPFTPGGGSGSTP